MRSSFAELVAWLADAPPWSKPKNELPLWCPATFAKDHRLAAGLECVSMLAFDIDAKHQPDPWDAARLEGLCADLLAGVAWLAHSTYSATAETPSWRLILPLASPLNAARWAGAHSLVAAAFARRGLITDPAAADVARGYFVPVRAGSFYASAHGEGEPLNGDAYAERASLRAPLPTVTDRYRPLPPPRGGDPLARARAYLAKIEPAISGQGGHAQTFAAALKIATLFELTEAQTLAALIPYGARCVPPWSEKELRHKAADACRVARRA